MKTFTLVFKNKETLTIPQEYIESYRDKGNGHIVLSFDQALHFTNFFKENEEVLVNHNMSTTLGIFSFCDVDSEVWNMSDCVPTEIAISAINKKVNELQICYIDE